MTNFEVDWNITYANGKYHLLGVLFADDVPIAERKVVTEDTNRVEEFKEKIRVQLREEIQLYQAGAALAGERERLEP